MHGQVSSLLIDAQFKNQGLERALMNNLEDVTTCIHDAYFVGLFINKVAVDMYTKLGYEVYRIVEKFYCDEIIQPAEDGYDMARDVLKECSRRAGNRIQPEELEEQEFN